MGKGRLEAFSDGVIAIIITIMVLELKVPHTTDLAGLRDLAPIMASYVLSFVYVAIYWHNHHHLLHTAKHIDGRIMWGNTHLLFWLSLVPFSTGWMGENHYALWPVVLYGGNLLACGLAYFILQQLLLRSQGENSTLAKALGNDIKGKLSPILYLIALALAFVHPLLACAIYVAVALIWLLPDPRIERLLGS